MFRVLLILLCLVLITAACGSNPEESEKTPKIKLEKKTALPSVDGKPFMVKSLPKGIKRIDANLDNRVMLLGYSINSDTLAPGQTLIITWFWKSLKVVDGEWEYFTHLMDEDGDIVTSVNSRGAMRSKYKPQMWKPGEMLQDIEKIQIPADSKSNILEIRTGLWQGPDRMKIVKGPMDGEGRVKGPVITVSANAPQPVAVSNAAVNIQFTSVTPEIDGKIDDEAWAAAAVLTPFVNTLNGRPVREKTQVKLLWDDANLYVAMSADDSELINPADTENDDIWKADAFDLFVMPAESGPYYEIQISPQGIIFDAKYESYRKADVNWKSNINLAVDVSGTVNDNGETRDTGWRLEAAIPLAGLLSGPLENQTVKGNFFRIDKTANGTVYSGWSAPMRGDFHAKDRFGKLVFKK